MIDLRPDGELMQRHIKADDEAWNSRLAGMSQRYKEEFAALEGALLRNMRDEERCLVCRTAVGACARSEPLGVVHIVQVL